MKEKKKYQLIPQIIILFAVSVLLVGNITYFSQRSLSDSNIKKQTELFASEIAEEVTMSIKEYPAYEWLISYWYSHAYDMNIEYDVDFGSGTETEEKCRQLNERYPGIRLKYVSQQELEVIMPEDQKLYAEIAYTWVTTRLNQIKRAYHIDFLFVVLTNENYQTQFFLLSAADEGAKRGKKYKEVYPLGNVVTVNEDQEEAMRSATEDTSYLAKAGDYVDYYTWFDEIKGHPVFIGMTYDVSLLRSSATQQAHRETLHAALYQFFLSLICLLLIYRVVLKPLKKVQKNIRYYKQTKDSETIRKNLGEVRPHNEIGELSEDVSELAQEIEDYIGRIETITAEKERISTEMSLAKRIQTAMLPHIYPAFPGRTEFDIYATMDPAREVGGDFYDFFLVDNDHLGMVMADVSGKGVPAALFMMASKIILQSCAMLGGTPAEILTKTNEAICSNNQEEIFVTVWLGILDIPTGRLTAANAGHEYPVLKKSPDESFELLKDKHGFVIGGMPGMKYTEYELQLVPGTKLFLYTDGVPEATDEDENMFGIDRMVETLNEVCKETPEHILKHVRVSVDAFVKGAEQFDDLTMLCLEYRGIQKEEE